MNDSYHEYAKNIKIEEISIEAIKFLIFSAK